MAYASVTYTSASGTTFALTNSSGDPIPYLKQSDISVTVNGVVLTQGTQYTFNTAGTAVVLATAVSGATVIINRLTDIADPTVVYTAGSTLTAQDLNNADNQIRYGLQEFSDTYAALTSGTGDLQTLGGFIGSGEAWSSDNAHAATTAAIDTRVDGKIDTALTTDVVAGDSITVTDNSPGSGQITIGVTNASISTAKLVDSSVTTAKIADSNVTTVKIANSNVTTAKIADANVTTAKIADSAITSAKIADGTIVAADLASDSVTTAKILDANVTTAKIADANVTTGKLADGSVTSAKIADGTIVAGDIASDAVTTAKILDSNVTEAKIATGAVTTTKIADSAVTAIKIPDGVLTTAKLTGSTVVTAAEQATSTPDDTSFFTTSASDARYVNVTGDTMSGALAMGSNKITGLGTPTASGDAATKGYVDSSITAASIPDADYGDITVSGTGSVWSIDTGAVTSAKIADDTIVNADINTSAAIAHSKLASIVAGRVLLGNASNVPTATALSGDVTVDSSGVTAIGSGVIVDADISGTAAIALSKLATGALPTNITVASANIVDGTIVDADISGSAEIAVSKLADGAARQLLQTDAAGTGVEWASNIDIPGTLDVTSAATFDSTIGASAGTAAAPSLYFKDSGTDTGLYSPGADQVAITTAGSGRLFVDASGRILVGTSSSSIGGSGSIVLQGSAGPGVVRAAFGGTSPGSTDIIGAITFTDSSHTGAAYIYGSRDGGTWTSTTSQPSALSFGTTPSGSGTVLERARIDSSGRLLVGTSTARSNFLGSASAAFQVEGNLSAGSTGQIISHVYGESAAVGGPYLVLGKHRSGSIGGTTLVANNDQLGGVSFTGADGTSFREGARIQAFVDGTPGANDMPGRLVFSTTADGASSPTEQMRITSVGDVFVGTTTSTPASFNGSSTLTGSIIFGVGSIVSNRADGLVGSFNRLTSDGVIISLRQAGTEEGTISVSGTTVSYNGAHLSRWSQIPGIDPYDKTVRPEILRGTVMSNLDEMCDWTCPESGDCQDNEQLNKTKISDVEGDKNVAGIFQSWDDDDDTWVNDFYLAMTGDFVIRIAAGMTVERGDLLMSAGDGTAKPQDDDIIRSKTIAKVTSTNVSCTYDDGSYCVPCVLMAC